MVLDILMYQMYSIQILYVDAYKVRHIAEKCPENLKQMMEMPFTLEINELKDAEFGI